MSTLQLDNLKKELQRLTSEEEERKREYYGSRADLQEIWDKLVSLRTHINKFESEIENAKIEDIMRGTGSNGAMDYASMSHRSMASDLSLESAGRLADINKLKEKLRTKDVLRGRIAILEDRILDGRRQLSKCTDAMKSGAAHYTLNSEQYRVPAAAQLPNAANPNGSIHKVLTARQALLAISENITEWEDELRRARSEFKSVESEVSQEINPTAQQHSLSYSTLTSIGGAAARPMSSSNLSFTPGSKAVYSAGSVDESIQDMIAHGPPLSSDLASALRQGVEHIFDASNNRTNTNLTMSECEFSLHEIMSGQASIVRINGEAPKVYILRLQRRLGSLLTLELQIQLEFQAKVVRVKQARDMLRDVEIKRLRVELQVSNLQQTLTAQVSGSAGVPQVEESLRRYESHLRLFTSQLNTPASKLTLPRTVSDLTTNTFDFMPMESTVKAERQLVVTPGPTSAAMNVVSASKVSKSVPNSPPAGRKTPQEATSPRTHRTTARSTSRSPNRPMRFTSSGDTKSPARSRSTERIATNSGSKDKEVTEGYMYGINANTTSSSVSAAVRKAATFSPSRRAITTSPSRKMTRSTTAAVSTTKPSAEASNQPINNLAAAPTYLEASSIAADILSNILKHQSRQYTSPYAQRNRPHSASTTSTPHANRNGDFSLRTPSPYTSSKHYTPSTADIHHQIIQYMKVHNLDPHVHYTSIIKAIKIHVLSTLLSNDLSQAEVQHTADLIQSSPMRANDGSNRLHRYFNNQDSIMSPIPLPAEYNSNDHTPNSVNAINTRHNNHADGSNEGYSSSDESVINVTNSNTLNNLLATSTTSTTNNNIHTSSYAKNTTAKNAKLRTKSASSKLQPSQRWRAGTAIVTNSINTSTQATRGRTLSRDRNSTPTERNGTLPLTTIHTTQALHQAVAALSETYNEQDFPLVSSTERCLHSNNKPAIYSKGHSSVRRSCSCASCAAASAEKDGDNIDYYKYRTRYNRHGHRTSDALAEAPSSNVFTENDIGNILADSPNSKSHSPNFKSHQDTSYEDFKQEQQMHDLDDRQRADHRDSGSKKAMRGANVSFHIGRIESGSGGNSPVVLSPTRIPQRSFSHSPPREKRSLSHSRSPSRSPATSPVRSSTTATTISDRKSPFKANTQSPGRRWSDPVHHSQQEDRDDYDNSEREGNRSSPLRSSRPPRSRHSTGGTSATNYNSSNTNINTGKVAGATSVVKHSQSPTKVVRKNTYQSPSPIRENPRFNTKLEPPQIFVSEVFNSPSVKLSGNDGDVSVQADTVAKRNYVREIFSSPVRAAPTNGVNSTSGGVQLAFPGTYFKKTDPTTATGSSPVRERWLAQNAGKTIGHSRYCMICSTMVAPGGVNSGSDSAQSQTLDGQGTSCPHTNLFDEPVTTACNNHATVSNNGNGIAAEKDVNNTTSSGFAGSLFENDTAVEPSRVRLMSSESLYKSPKTTNRKGHSSQATGSQQTIHTARENAQVEVTNVPQVRTIEPPPLPHEFETAYRANSSGSENKTSADGGNDVGQSKEYQKLLQMLAHQQKEIEALRSAQLHPIHTTNPIAVTNTLSVSAHASEQATSVPRMAIRSVSDDVSSTATRSEHTAGSQTKFHRIGEDGLHQPLSVAKPRLGGGNASVFGNLSLGGGDNMSRNSVNESSDQPNTDNVGPAMHSRRAVRPTSLNHSDMGANGVGVGGSAVNVGRKADMRVDMRADLSHTQTANLLTLGASSATTSHNANLNNNGNTDNQAGTQAAGVRSTLQPDIASSTTSNINHINNTTRHTPAHALAPATSQPAALVPHFTPSHASRHAAHVPNLADLADGSPHHFRESEMSHVLPLPLPPPFPAVSKEEGHRDQCDQRDQDKYHLNNMHDQTAQMKASKAPHNPADIHDRHHNHRQSSQPAPPPHQPVHQSQGHSQPRHHPQQHPPAAFDPTSELTLRCLHERIEKLKHKYETARAHEVIHPHFGVAMNSDGTSKAYADVNIISAKNLPEMKILSKRCDAYIETQLITQLPMFHNNASYNPVSTIHTMNCDTSTFMSGYVYKRLDLLYHAHNYAQYGWPAGGVDASLLDAVVDDVSRGVLYHSYSRTSVQPDTLFPEWREFFKITNLTQLNTQYLCFTVRDSAYIGHEISQDDPIIGFCVLPLTADVLRDQHPHNVWLPLQQPAEHKHSAAHRLREDCALKVEIKVHYSEQQFWKDLQNEAESILHKVTTALSHPHGHSHASSGLPSGGLDNAGLTATERRKVEKWVEAMSARPVTSSHSHAAGHHHQRSTHQHSAHLPRRPVPPMDHTPQGLAQQTRAHAPLLQGQDSHGQHHHYAQDHNRGLSGAVATDSRLSGQRDEHILSEQDDRLDPPLSLHLDASALAYSSHYDGPSTTSSVTQSPYNPAYANHNQQPLLPYEAAPSRFELHTPGGLAARHFETQATPTISAHMTPYNKAKNSTSNNSAQTLRGLSKENSTSFVRPTAETRAALKYTGLREENNRDVFYKSLRSSVDSAAKPSTETKARSARSQQSIVGSSSATPHSAASARIFTAESFFASQAAVGNGAQVKTPPALPYESKGNFPTAQNSFRVQAAKKDEPELTRERAVPSAVNSNKSRVGSHNPPPLPAQLASHGSKIDLSIFKRARTDVVYQGEMRNETSHKLQQTAANINEKVGFMSGKQRQLKF